jgi:uncharacterized protein with HEPN domain
MRNRMAHGYLDINLDVGWSPVQTSLPDSLKALPAMRQAAEGDAASDSGTGA